jgi:2-keto-4-pentenoate hydratase/2-oxohepta-3-ene-1,7-dioic acid hydratase in catechol pathway
MKLVSLRGGGRDATAASSAADGRAMGVGFHDLIAHAAPTRELCAGTIVGSGTVSNDNYRQIGLVESRTSGEHRGDPLA